MNTRTRIRTAALDLFSEVGYEATSIAEIRRRAGVSNGSFFHAFPTKEALAADLYLQALEAYHQALESILASRPTAAAGIDGMLRAHLGWVTECEPQAKLLFEQVRSEWVSLVRAPQHQENSRFMSEVSDWRLPLIASEELMDIPAPMFIAQLIGPAQIFCRAWLSGRSSSRPQEHASILIACACKALLR